MVEYRTQLNDALTVLLTGHPCKIDILNIFDNTKDIECVGDPRHWVSKNTAPLILYKYFIDLLSNINMDKTLFDLLPVPRLNMKILNDLELWSIWNIYRNIYTMITPIASNKLKHIIFDGGYLLSDSITKKSIGWYIFKEGPKVLIFFPEKILLNIAPFNFSEDFLNFIISLTEEQYESYFNELIIFPPDDLTDLKYIKLLDFVLLRWHCKYQTCKKEGGFLQCLKILISAGAKSIDPSAVLKYISECPVGLPRSIKALYLKPSIRSIYGLPIPFEAKLSALQLVPYERAFADRLLAGKI